MPPRGEEDRKLAVADDLFGATGVSREGTEQKPPPASGRRETTLMSEQPHYAMDIRWSDEDQAYLVCLPDWEGYLLNWRTATHGATYEEAARHGHEVLEMLVTGLQDEGKPLPPARSFATTA